MSKFLSYPLPLGSLESVTYEGFSAQSLEIVGLTVK